MQAVDYTKKRYRSVIVYTLLSLAILISAYLHVVWGEQGDKSWLLMAAKFWLRGDTLYVDVLEVNPPLIIWICAISVKLQQWLPALMDYEWHALLGGGTVFSSAYVTSRWMSAAYTSNKERNHRRESFILIAFAQICYFSFVFFFDREHMFATLILPYACSMMPSARATVMSVKIRIITGIMASIGFSLKPHCLVILSAILMMCIVKERSLKSVVKMETLIIAAVGLGYLCLTALVHPEYYTFLLPIALATYGEYTTPATLLSFTLFALALVSINFVNFRWSQYSPYQADIRYWLGMMVAALCYALVNNGWVYTLVPFYSFFYIILLLLWWHYSAISQDTNASVGVQTHGVHGRNGCIIALVLHYAIAWTAIVETRNLVGCEHNNNCTLRQSMRQVISEEKVENYMVFSLNFVFWSNIARTTQTTWISPVHMLWPLRSIIWFSAKESPEIVEVKEKIFSRFVHSLAIQKPQWVFVDGDYNQALTQFIAAHAALSASFNKEWAKYEPFIRVGQCAEEDNPENKAAFVPRMCSVSIFKRQTDE